MDIINSIASLKIKAKQMLVLFFVLIMIVITSIIICKNVRNNFMRQNGIPGNNQVMPGGHHGMMNNQNIQQDGQWIAPPNSNKMINPLAKNTQATAEGKNIFKKQCSICHGETGKGDGMAGAGLNPKPTNLTSENIAKQSDGTIFWKITTGKSPMHSVLRI